MEIFKCVWVPTGVTCCRELASVVGGGWSLPTPAILLRLKPRTVEYLSFLMTVAISSFSFIALLDHCLLISVESLVIFPHPLPRSIPSVAWLSWSHLCMSGQHPHILPRSHIPIPIIQSIFPSLQDLLTALVTVNVMLMWASCPSIFVLQMWICVSNACLSSLPEH